MSGDYVLGHSQAEHARLMRQARLLHPATRQLLSDAGIGPGQRVLDIGAGVGDVSLLAGHMVGAGGYVCGVDADPAALATARTRAKDEALAHVEFRVQDLNRLSLMEHFDAIVGRLVLMFFTPVSRLEVLKALSALVRPGGVLVLQECSWQAYFALAAHLPLHTACGELICQSLRGAGAQPDMALPLHQQLADAGWRVRQMCIHLPLAVAPADPDWTADLLIALRARLQQQALDTAAVGEIATLRARLQRELAATRSFAPVLGLVGAIAVRDG
ncbi:MAG: methyltransferase domain-containing protein [Proteobacteria bacterium]|nr:methyltransferase domain-containing protein [Pseudomonadota bacterium]